MIKYRVNHEFVKHKMIFDTTKQADEYIQICISKDLEALDKNENGDFEVWGYDKILKQVAKIYGSDFNCDKNSDEIYTVPREDLESALLESYEVEAYSPEDDED